ncbi:MAG: pentapeptide repeat-containing protein [Myxococcota bacterium]
MDLIELLKSGRVTEFNNQRPMRGKVDLFAADLANAQISGADLSGANLEKADLSGADLSKCNLVKANLSGADLTGANLREIVGLKSRWREAYLGQADLTSADLSGANFNEAEFDDAILEQANLSGAKMKGAVLNKANLREADLSEARLGDARLIGANLAGANLPGASLSRADLTNAILLGAEMTGAKLESAVLKDADLSAVRLRNADLTGADFTGAILDQTDMTRADLTGAVIAEADFTQATLDEAQVEGDLSAQVSRNVPPPTQLLIEDPYLAVHKDRVAILWENPEPGGARLRVLVSKLSGQPESTPIPLPAPLDLILARALCATAKGFAVAVLIDRPGGVTVSLSMLDKNGQLTQQRTLRLGYTPLVRPILREEDKQLFLFGISREGPGLLVQQVTDEELDIINGERMSNVRGFVSDRDPVVLSKGGVVKVMGKKRNSPPMTAPSSFPGRSSASCGYPKSNRVAMIWAERGRAGLNTAVLEPNQPSIDQRLFPKKLIGNVTVAAFGDHAWAAFTIEAPTPDIPASAWGVRLPDGKPFPILDDPEHDADIVRFVEGANKPMLALSTLEGQLHIYTLTKTAAKLHWKLENRRS